MGEHQPNSSAARVAKHRAAMKAQGFRLKQFWVPDMRDPALQARLREESRIIAARVDDEKEVMGWVDAVTEGVWDDEPDYKW